MSAPPDYQYGKFGRSDGLVVIFEEAARQINSQILRQIIFKMTAMRRSDFPPMCDNARQGARHRRSVEPALKLLWEASTPDERHQRLHQVR
jgi:hypothetical protein